MRITIVLVLGACMLLPAHGQADRKKDRLNEPLAATLGVDVSGLMFTEKEQDLIRSYFGRHEYEAVDSGKQKGKSKKKKLPPGLRKKIERGGELPPGWQKKLARGEVIDGEMYAASHGLPEELIDDLGTVPGGTEIRRIEDEVVRLIEATGVIVDVLGL